MYRSVYRIWCGATGGTSPDWHEPCFHAGMFNNVPATGPIAFPAFEIAVRLRLGATEIDCRFSSGHGVEACARLFRQARRQPSEDAYRPKDPILLYTAWCRAGGRGQLHVYERGGHGFNLRPQGTTSDHWFDAFLRWLEAYRCAVPRQQGAGR